MRQPMRKLLLGLACSTALAAHAQVSPSAPIDVPPGDLARFPKVDLFGIDRFGGWKEAQATHFADGGVFDQIYKPTN